MKQNWWIGTAVVAAMAAALGIASYPSDASAQNGGPQAPAFEVDPLWPQPLPNNWVLGNIIGVSVDAQDNVWIIHRADTLEPKEVYAAANPPAAECCRPAPPVLQFNSSGKLLQSWGGPGEGFDWPNSNHGITVDFKGNVWIGGNGRGNNQVLKFTQGGKFLMQIGKPNASKGSNDVLEMEGYEPIAAENGRSGLEAARREKPDLVLCDVMMPEMDGHSVLSALRAEPALAMTPFIFLTAKGEKIDIRAGMNLGADDYLTKPARREELLAAISARLERAEAHAAQLQANARGFSPDFSSPRPLEQLGLTAREAEVLLWVAQGKSNAEIGIILNMAEATVKRHLSNMFEKLGLESRNAATLRALEILSSLPLQGGSQPKPQNHRQML